jgi:hypothetical protein
MPMRSTITGHLGMPFMMSAVQEGGGDQKGFERVGDAGVMAEVQQPVDVVLHVLAILPRKL